MTVQLYIEPQPEMGEGALRFIVDCPCCTTGMFWSPDKHPEFTERQVVMGVLQRHETACGRCNLVRLWQRYANRGLQELVERAWKQVGPYQTSERRN
jgi:hypothetical protein